jgi:hypothetical protein
MNLCYTLYKMSIYSKLIEQSFVLILIKHSEKKENLLNKVDLNISCFSPTN